MGAVQINDPAAIDELFTALRSLEWDRPDEEGGDALKKERLHDYQVGGGWEPEGGRGRRWARRGI